MRWRKGHVAVTAAGRRYAARAAIIAVPLGVLQARSGPGVIRFEPRLRDKARAWNGIAMGHVLRVTLWLHDDAWESGPIPAELGKQRGKGFGFLQSTTADFGVWWAHDPHPLLVGWSGGPTARRMAHLSDEALADRALRSLARILAVPLGDVRALVAAWFVHNWSRDPFSRGAYSHALGGQEQASLELARPVEETLFFAGEATAGADDLGTVQAALTSGIRAGREAVAALAPA